MRHLLLSALACTGLAAAATANAGEPLRVGLMAPVTGPWASEGQDMERVVGLLAENINAAGGINGRPVKIELADDAGDPRTAAMAAQRLVTGNVLAVVGTYGSAVTEAAQNIYAEEDIPQIATGSTSIRLSEKKLPFFFRTCPRDDDQGRVMAEKVIAMGHKNVALIHDNSSYAKGLADETRALLEKAEVKLVFFDAINPGERDYTTTLVKMKTVEPDIIVFTGYYNEAGMLLRQKKDMGWDVPMIGGDATNNAALIDITGAAAAQGYYFISPPGPADLEGGETKKFMEQYKAKYEAVPRSIWAVLAGDAFLAVVEALKNVENPSPTKIGAYLHNNLKDFEGFTGPIAFNAKGDRIGGAYRLYRVDAEGTFVLQP